MNNWKSNTNLLIIINLKIKNERWSNMEIRYYVDGKCILSYDDDVFSTDDDYTNIFITLFYLFLSYLVYKEWKCRF